MSLDDIFKTKTMARIFVEQGQLKKAAEIYLFLLKKNPNQKEIKNHLMDIRRRLNQSVQGAARDLKPLYEKWINLAIVHHQEKKQEEI
jgi:hypothetical protein